MEHSEELSRKCLATLTSTILKEYNSLGKAGKPSPGQWTVLAAVAMVKGDDVRLISFATGTKCLGGESRKSMAVVGSALHDSHAEVVAKRGLLLWLAKQVEIGGGELVEKVEGKKRCCWRLKTGWKLLLLTTHPPCGDATISPLSCVEEDSGEPCAKRSRLDEDINRTGGKVVGDEEDLGGQGKDFHTLGLLRTKPGRGPRTTSLSCSDKILKWNILGIQGALLSHLYPEPIYLSHFVLCQKPLHKPSLSRALWERAGMPANQPQLSYFPLDWPFQKQDGLQACPDTLVWVVSCDGSKPVCEALTGGIKQGWAKKKLKNPKSWSQLSRRKLSSCVSALIPEQFPTYAAIKSNSPQYSRRKALLGSILDLWPFKTVEDFSLSDIESESNDAIVSSRHLANVGIPETSKDKSVLV